MSQEIKFENDILVSTLNNPETSAVELFQAGLDTKNTGLLSPEEYKKSPVIQKVFSDENNVFNEQKFNQVYKIAADKYSELSAIKSWNDLEDDIEYNKTSIFAPLDAKTYDDRFKISRVRNPEKKALGIDALTAWSDSQYSIRELAQMNKIFDTKTQTWKDKTAEELGIFGGLISEPLVYATWDEEGEHFDEFLQRNVHHKKGEYKTDSEGNYYCETLGDREVYGKEVVAYGDILTKENSWLNKIDFFDSDGKTKSTFGTAMKTIAGVAPYLIPGFNKFYGALTASIGLAEVIPTFYKAIEGLTTGDDAERSDLFKFASKQEGFMKKFNGSVSDKSKDSLFNLEQAGNLVVDIFGQLYQMRAAASVSQLFKDTHKKQTQLIEGIKKTHADDLAKLASGEREAALSRILKNSKEFQELQKKSSDLASAFSLGYMALTSSADVYSDALQGGYGRRAAAIAALSSVVGQYGIMRHNPISDRLGTWMLDESVGFNVGVDRKALKEALRPLYGEFKTGAEKLAAGSAKEAKKGFAGLLSKGKNIIDKTKGVFDEGFNTLTSKMLIEGVEEVTEEAVQDMTKGVFDLLSSFGFAGMDGSFGGINNVFSKQGLERYVSSFLGGAVGGGLFHLNTTVIEPFFDKRLRPSDKYSLYNEIANGNTQQLLRMVDEICDKDSDLSSYTVTVDGEVVSGGTNTENGVTQKEWVKNNIKEHIKSLDAIINGAELNIDDENLVKQAVRQNELVLGFDNLGLDKLIISDRNKALAEYIEAKQKYDSAKDSTEEEKDIKNNLKIKAQEALNKVKAIQDGEKAEFYTNAGLILASPYARQLLQYTDIISYTRNVYNKNYTELSQDEKEKIEKEYLDFTEGKDTGPVLEALVNTYQDLQKTYGKAFKEYGENNNYKTNHKKVLSDLLTTALSDTIVNDQVYNREIIGRFLETLKKADIEGFTLEDTLDLKNLSEEDIFSRVENFDKAIDTLEKYLNNTGIDSDEFKTNLKKDILNDVKSVLQKTPVNSLTNELISNIIGGSINHKIDLFVNQLKTDPNYSVETVNEYFKSKGLKELSLDTDVTNLSDIIKNSIEFKSNDDSSLLDAHLQAGLSYLIDDNDNIKNIDFQLFKTVLERIDRVYRNYVNSTITDLAVKAEILKIVHQGISNMKPLGTIKNEILNSKVVKDQIEKEINNLNSRDAFDEGIGVDFTEEDTTTYKEIQTLFNKFNNSGLAGKYFTLISNKNIFEHNPFYDLLEKLTFQITKDGKAVNLLKILKEEEQRINESASLDEYNNPAAGKETIQKLKNALTTIQVLVAGMQKGAMYEYSIGINEQMNYHNKAYGDGNTQLETIDIETAVLINADIENLKSKLDYILAISNTTSESQFKNNEQIKNQYYGQLLTKYKFIFRDEDIFDDDIKSLLEDPIESNEYKVNMVEHLLFQKFDAYKKEHGVKNAVEKFFGKIKLEEEAKMKSFGIGIDTKDITNKDLIIRLASAIMQDSGEFAIIYKNIIEKNKSNHTSFVPFFTQETAIRIASAFATERLKTSFNPKHESVLDALSDLYRTEDGYVVDFNTLFINGVAGSGKTSVIMSSVLKTLAQKAPTSLKLVIATAPSERQIENLKRSLSTGLTEEEIKKIGLDSSEDQNVDKILKQFISAETYTEIELSAQNLKLDGNGLVSAKKGSTVKLNVSEISDKIRYSGDPSKKPNVIFIDEVTHVASYKLQLLSEICKKEGIILITSGDLSQEGKSIAINDGTKITNYQSNIDSICCFQTPQIISSVRNSNIHTRNNNSKFVLALNEYQRVQAEKDDMFAESALVNFLQAHPIELDYYETEDELHGYKLSKTLSLEDLKRLKNALAKKRTTNPNAKIGIITELDASNNIVDVEFKRQIESVLTSDEYELYAFDSSHPKAAQGSEEEYVIINNPKFDSRTVSDNFKKFYTMVTRSHQGAIVVTDMSNPIFEYVKNTIPKETTGMFSLPIDSYLGRLLSERISDLENISAKTGVTSIETIVDARRKPSATIVPEPKEEPKSVDIEEEPTTSKTSSKTTIATSKTTSPTTSSSTASSITTPSSTTTTTTNGKNSKPKPKTKEEVIEENKEQQKNKEVLSNTNGREETNEIDEINELKNTEGINKETLSNNVIIYPFYVNLSNSLDSKKRYKDVPLNLGNYELKSGDSSVQLITNGFTKLKNIISANYNTKNKDEIKKQIKYQLLKAIENIDEDLIAIFSLFADKPYDQLSLITAINKNEIEIDDNFYLIGEEYYDKSNAPYNKINDDERLHLADGSKLLTCGVKLVIKGKERYISLFKFISDSNYYNEFYNTNAYTSFYEKYTSKAKQNKPQITKIESLTLDKLQYVGNTNVRTHNNGSDLSFDFMETQGTFVIGTAQYKGQKNQVITKELKENHKELQNIETEGKTAKFIVLGTVPKPTLEQDKKYIKVIAKEKTLKEQIEQLKIIENFSDKGFRPFTKNSKKISYFLFSDFSLNTIIVPAILDYIKSNGIKYPDYSQSEEEYKQKISQYLKGENVIFKEKEGRAIFKSLIYINSKGETCISYKIGNDYTTTLIDDKTLEDIKFYPEFPTGDKNLKIDSINKSTYNFIKENFDLYGVIEPGWVGFDKNILFGDTVPNDTTTKSTTSNNITISEDTVENLLSPLNDTVSNDDTSNDTTNESQSIIKDVFSVCDDAAKTKIEELYNDNRSNEVFKMIVDLLNKHKQFTFKIEFKNDTFAASENNQVSADDVYNKIIFDNEILKILNRLNKKEC